MMLNLKKLKALLERKRKKKEKLNLKAKVKERKNKIMINYILSLSIVYLNDKNR